MRNCYKILLFILATSFFNSSDAQEIEEVRIESQQEETSVVVDTVRKHSPKLATWMSVAVPGAGQFYNKSYWKIPVIYIAGGALVYSTIQNSNGYHEYKNAYNQLYEDKDNPMEGYEFYTLDQLKSVKDQYRRYRDLSVIGLVLLYVLNIVDATVDGYFFDYDVSNDLSLRVEPSIMNSYSHNSGFKANQQYRL